MKPGHMPFCDGVCDSYLVTICIRWSHLGNTALDISTKWTRIFQEISGVTVTNVDCDKLRNSHDYDTMVMVY